MPEDGSFGSLGDIDVIPSAVSRNYISNCRVHGEHVLDGARVYHGKRLPMLGVGAAGLQGTIEPVERDILKGRVPPGFSILDFSTWGGRGSPAQEPQFLYIYSYCIFGL